MRRVCARCPFGIQSSALLAVTLPAFECHFKKSTQKPDVIFASSHPSSCEKSFTPSKIGFNEPVPPAGKEWSDNELEAAIKAYLKMLDDELAGRPYSKAEANRQLCSAGEALCARSRPSIEYRMRNISAVFQNLGYRTIAGYAPARNVGTGTTARLLRILENLQLESRFKIPPPAR